MKIRQEIGIFWSELTRRQQAAVLAAVLILTAIFLSGWVRSLGTSMEVRKYERQATVAKREAEDALKLAAKIAKEKLEVERTVAELEAKFDEKEKQTADAHLKTLDARSDYERALREQRGDNPGTEQLCAELAALGYPCEQ